MALELGGDGVRQGSDDLATGRVVVKDGELGTEELVRLADGNLDGYPVPGRRDRRPAEAVGGEPRIDGGDALRIGRDVSLNLQPEHQQSQRSP